MAIGDRSCEKCGYPRPDVKRDLYLRKWLCAKCWFHTDPAQERPPGPPERREG